MIVVDDTFADLRKLAEADLGDAVSSIEAARVLIDWFHYRARVIACRPRLVTMSKNALEQTSAFPAISRIADALREGADMRPWLSDGVRLRKADHRADMLFNDWQVSHFHLSPIFVNPNKTKRTKQLLLAYIDTKEAVILKVGDHSSWTNEDVLLELLETRPDLIERHELKGVLAPRENKERSDTEKLLLRKAGITSNLVLKGRIFIPSLGISSSGHATRLVLKAQRFLRAINKCKDDIKNNALPSAARSRLAFPIGVPVQLRVRLETNGDLLIYDANRSWGFFRESAPA